MPTILKTKNSVTTTVVPTTLQQGELAVNITDKKMWVGNAATTPVQLFGAGADSNFTNISVSGVATFGAGTVSLPSITTTGDTNTGIFFPAADTIAFTEGGVESMRIDSTGNIGVGVTPSAWESSTYRALQISTGVGSSSLVSRADSVNGGGLVLNGFYSATGWKYVGSSYSTLYLQNTGTHQWYTSAAGTAGNAITFSEVMRITDAGNVGIGTTSPSYKLQVSATSATVGITSTTAGQTPYLILNNTADSSNSYIFCPNKQLGLVQADASASSIVYFSTQNTERMRIDSSGNVGIGASPGTVLDVYRASGNPYFRVYTGTGSVQGYMQALDSTYVKMGSLSNHDLGLTTNGTERMRITTAGNVGIGTSSPTAPLDITSSTAGYMNLDGGSSSGQGSFIRFRKGGTDIGYIGVAGAVLGSTSSDFLMYADGATRNAVFWTNGAERMRIGSDGKVGIGTTTLTNALNVAGAIQSSSTLVAVGANTVALSQESGYARLAAFGPNSSTGGTLYLYSISSNGGVQNGAVIDANGNFIVSGTSTSSDDSSYQKNGEFTSRRASSGGTYHAYFFNGGTQVGSITSNTANTFYNITSDYRLKENATPVTTGLQTILSLNPVNFDWISKNISDTGFLAHEFESVIPNSVMGAKDATDKDGKPIYQQMDRGRAIPFLVAAIKEQQTLIENLTARLTALENK